jgi:hypothetical protein
VPRDVGRGGSLNRLGAIGSIAATLNFERTISSQLKHWFAGIYIQVFGNKSAENSGRYNV